MASKSIDWDNVLVTQDPKKKEVLISFPGDGFGFYGSLESGLGGADPGAPAEPIEPPLPEPEPVPPVEPLPECDPHSCDALTLVSDGIAASTSFGITEVYTNDTGLLDAGGFDPNSAVGSSYIKPLWADMSTMTGSLDAALVNTSFGPPLLARANVSAERNSGPCVAATYQHYISTYTAARTFLVKKSHMLPEPAWTTPSGGPEDLTNVSGFTGEYDLSAAIYVRFDSNGVLGTNQSSSAIKLATLGGTMYYGIYGWPSNPINSWVNSITPSASAFINIRWDDGEIDIYDAETKTMQAPSLPLEGWIVVKATGVISSANGVARSSISGTWSYGGISSPFSNEMSTTFGSAYSDLSQTSLLVQSSTTAMIVQPQSGGIPKILAIDSTGKNTSYQSAFARSQLNYVPPSYCEALP